MRPDWFDWLSLAVTVIAAALPAWLAIVLWRSDRKVSIRERRDIAAREFTNLLAVGDRVLVRFRDFGYLADAMGPGSRALLALVDRLIEWDGDDEREEEAKARTTGLAIPREPRLDLSVDVTTAISRWLHDPSYRADLTEVFLANGYICSESEDNRIISPTMRRGVEDEILSDPREYRDWLAATRLAPTRVRRRRLLGRLQPRSSSLTEPLNPLATNDYLAEDEIDGDEWLRERSSVAPEECGWQEV